MGEATVATKASDDGDMVAPVFLLLGGVEFGNGILMLIAPNQFAGPAYVSIAGILAFYGAVLVLAGSILLLAAVGPLRGHRRLATLAVLALVPLWVSFIRAPLVSGVVTLGIQGAAGAVAGLGVATAYGWRRLIIVTLGAIQLGQFGAMLVVPQQYSAAAIYGSYGGSLWLFGPAFLLGGAGLLFVRGGRWFPAVGVLAAGNFAALAFVFAGTRIWTGVVNYGLMLAILLAAVTASTLRHRAVRLVLFSAIALASVDLLAWLLLIPGAGLLVPDATTTRPIIAIGTIAAAAAGLALVTERRHLALSGAAIAGVIGVLAVLMSQETGTGSLASEGSPRDLRPSTTAGGLMLAVVLAVASLSSTRSHLRHHIAAVLAIVVIALSSLNLLAYVANQPVLFAAYGIVSMRLNTGMAMALLGAALLLLAVRPIARASVGGRLAVGLGGILALVALQLFIAITALDQIAAGTITAAQKEAARSALLGFMVLIVAAMFWVSYGIVRSIVSPLGTLIATMSRYGSGDHDSRAPRLGRDEFGRAALIFNRMARELGVIHRDLEELALQDALTGLPNRRLLSDRLAQAIHDSDRERKTFSVLSTDLDGFKRVNDRLGHAAGDALLIETGERIRSVLRPADTLARTGGDEFVVVLAGADRPAAEHVAGRIRIALTAPFVLEAESVNVGTSVGIATYPTDGTTPQALLAFGDRAMYAAKGSR